ncbi:MAG: glycosyltransferase family 39 protein, partial [Chloroflexota bacterium]
LEDSPGQPGFQLHFFNDVERFNFYEAPDPDRKSLPFSVRYEGYLHPPRAGTIPVDLTARGLAILSLDGKPVLTVGSRDAEASDRAEFELEARQYAVQLDFLHQGGEAPSLRLAADFGSGLQLLGPPLLTRDAVSANALARDRFLGLLALGLDLLVLAGLAGAVVLAAILRASMIRSATAGRLALTERPLLAGLLLTITVYALVTTADLAGRTTVLEGGQDWLTYESYSRDILLNGPLMTLGEPLGKGKPFFFQPFYPYYLAAMHWLTGEGLWGPIVLQIVGDGLAAVLIYFLAKRLFGAPAAVAALVLFLILGLSQLDWIARKLLSENLYFWVLPAGLLLLTRAFDERRLWDVALAGCWFGVAAITRAPTLLFVPGSALFLAWAWHRAGESWRRAALAFVTLGFCTALVASVVPLRNYIVSGKPSLVATNGGATLLLAHQPTDRVSLRGVDRDPLYNALKLDRATREVVEFMRQDPVGYFWTLVPLGLYSIGVSGAVENNPPLAPDVLAITLLYVVAVAVLPAARTLRTWPLHLFIVIHLGIMMTFLPYVYGYRQVLPMQVLMLVFDGALLARLAGALGDRRRAARPGQPVMEQRTA